MKLYYVGEKIYQALYNDDVIKTHVHFNVPHGVYTIDELDPENKDLCHDITATLGKRDIDGNYKYFIDTDLDLCVNEGWVEHVINIQEIISGKG